jgi:hypothetical protein
MRAFVQCVIAYLGSFLGSLGWIALAALIACILLALAGGIAGGVAAIPLFVLCLKAAGIVIGASILIALEEAIRQCW